MPHPSKRLRGAARLLVWLGVVAPESRSSMRIAHGFHLVVIAQDGLVLLANEGHGILRQVFFESFFVFSLCIVVALLQPGEDSVIAGSECFLGIDPGTMQCC